MILSVNKTGDGVVVDFFRFFDDRVARGTRKGIVKITQSVFRHAMTFLSGHQHAPAGDFPIPSRTGHLRQKLAFLEPGRSKGDFKAGDMEGIVYNSAIYAPVIAKGDGSSAKFGKRDFLPAGLNKFLAEESVESIVTEEIIRELQ